MRQCNTFFLSLLISFVHSAPIEPSHEVLRRAKKSKSNKNVSAILTALFFCWVSLALIVWGIRKHQTRNLFKAKGFTEAEAVRKPLHEGDIKAN